MSEMFDFKNYQWRKMAKNGDGEFAFFICQIRHFAIAPHPKKQKKKNKKTPKKPIANLKILKNQKKTNDN